MTDLPPKRYVAVIGPGDASAELRALAEEVGRLLAEGGAVVVTGGLGGVMAAACRGARQAGGTTIGLLPGRDRNAANEWVEFAIPTGLAEMRNALVVGAADTVIAVGTSWGTLSEIALARRTGRTVIGLHAWAIADEAGQPVPDGVVPVEDAAQAVALALSGA
jgi:hypothetical protein